jgi:hypothetical protein
MRGASGGWGLGPQTPFDNITIRTHSGALSFNKQNGVWGLRPQPPEASLL